MRCLPILILSACAAPGFGDEVVQHAQELYDDVQDIMGTDCGRVEFVITELATWPHTPACYEPATGEVYLDARLELTSSALTRYVIAHELVHAMAIGYWDTLPLPLEEGLADMIALSLVPEAAEEATDLQPADRRLYLTLVRRHGIAKLRTQAQRAYSEGLDQIPVEWLR